MHGVIRTTAKRLLLAFAVAIVIAGCGSNVIGPENHLEVTNAADNFQWQVEKLDNVAQTLTYTWSNSGSMASVNQACAISKGSAVVVIRDAVGTEVYRRSLKENGSFASAQGMAGDWTIIVTLSNTHGNLNFRVQKL